MFDWVPLRVWLLIGIAAMAYAPMLYVYRYVANSPSRRDITKPREDLGWRTPAKLALSIVSLVMLVALAVFIFTPAATDFAASPSFWPIIMTGLTAFCLFTVVEGLTKGEMELIMKGGGGRYSRQEQPKRFWASVAWNVTLTAVLIWMVFNMWTNPEWSW